jgi:hypothetical protein
MTLHWEINPATLTAGGNGRVNTIQTAQFTLTNTWSGTGGPALSQHDGTPILLLNGSDPFLSTGITDYTPPTSGALIMRVKTPAAMSSHQWSSLDLFEWQNGFNTHKLALQVIWNPARMRARFGTVSDVFSDRHFSPLPTDEAWHNWIMKWAPGVPVELYRDGQLVGTVSGSNPGTISTSGSVLLGAQSSPAGSALMYAAMHSGAVDAVALDAATTAMFTSIEPHDVTVSWAPPLADGGAEVTGYVVQVMDEESGFQEIADATSPTVFTGTVGAVRVVAVNNIGRGRAVERPY